MSTPDYKISINGGGGVLPATLGIEPGIKVSNGSFLSGITFTTAGLLDATPVIGPFQRANILGLDGAVVASGWLDEDRRRAQEGAEGWEYVLAGPWRFFERTPFLAQRWGAEGLADSGIVTLGAKTQLVSGLATTGRITLVEQITDVFARVNAKFPDAVTLNIDITDLHIPWERRINDSCADVLLALLQWAPDVRGVWTFSAGGCTLNLVETGPARTCGETLSLSDASVRPRYDLLYDFVEVIYRYEQPTQQEGDDSLEPWINAYTVTDSAVAGPDGTGLGAARTLSRTINLQPGEPITGLIDLPEGSISVAGKVAEAVGRLQLDGEFTIQGGIDWARRPGDEWKFSASFGVGTTRYAVAQVIERDLHLGTERVIVGPPKHLGIDDLAALWKRRALSQDAAAPKDAADGTNPQSDSSTSSKKGSLKVDLGPAAVRTATPPAKWYIAGRPQKSSGQTLKAIPIGKVTVQFLDLKGWITPPAKEVEITDGGTASISEADATYTKSLTVGLNWALDVREKADSDPESPTYEARVTEGQLTQGDVPTPINVTGIGEWSDVASFPCDYWLKVTFDADGAPTAAEIFHTGGGDTFDRTLAAYEAGSAYEQDATDDTRPYPQTLVRKFIGTLTQDAPNTLPVVSSQAFTGDLVLLWDIVAGFAAQTPYQR